MVIPVLLYHSISHAKSALAVSPENFESQLRYLKSRGYSTITPKKLLEYFKKRKFERKKALITFDDGFEDNKSAADLLEKYGFRGVFFIIGSLVGKTAIHCTEEDMNKRPILNSKQIQELEIKGHIIANHFYSHKRLDELDKGVIVEEFEKNFSLLKNFVKDSSSLRVVAYPKNKVNQQVFEAMRDLGVEIGFGGKNRPSSIKDGPLAVSRIQIFPNDTISRFAIKLSRLYGIYKARSMV